MGKRFAEGIKLGLPTHLSRSYNMDHLFFNPSPENLEREAGNILGKELLEGSNEDKAAVVGKVTWPTFELLAHDKRRRFASLRPLDLPERGDQDITVIQNARAETSLHLDGLDSFVLGNFDRTSF